VDFLGIVAARTERPPHFLQDPLKVLSAFLVFIVAARQLATRTNHFEGPLWLKNIVISKPCPLYHSGLGARHDPHTGVSNGD
jgi:hypothetical protein